MARFNNVFIILKYTLIYLIYNEMILLKYYFIMMSFYDK
ncbi:hypothetical protein XBFM1_820017 [Xenorhabdus bovienii str. feltiae Moldova]|uniref:Uncharacterized protein n=1 Tax=Xenorhabdus bovienii str. feltiae Moldova TaxID=1398200 RepID=A0A077NNE0_XENBV|nr:hypothetical protein XBFM1_820017 [Xenorhabdus bovienii str. feltiae Moldova]